MFFIVDIKFRLTYGEFYGENGENTNFVKFSTIKSMIVKGKFSNYLL